MDKLIFNPISTTINIIDNDPIILETGKIAKQTDGSIVIRQGDTMLLVTVCHNEEENTDFFPLMVDYREPIYSAGRIPGGWFKREGKQTIKETLISRLIDRAIRPLFSKNYRCETMINVQVISFDGQHQPDILGIIGASAALIISDLPFYNPIGSVRVGRIKNKFIINPTISQQTQSDLDLVVAGTKETIVMVECGAKEIKEAEIIKALDFSQNAISNITSIQKELQIQAGKTKIILNEISIDSNLYDKLSLLYKDELLTSMSIKNKLASNKSINHVKSNAISQLTEIESLDGKEISNCFDLLKENIFREVILKKHTRLDSRNFDQIRPLNIEVGILPTTHGSCLFTRGETQALVTTTLGTAEDIQTIDGLEEETKKSFYLHYNFPGYAVNECRPNRNPGRREIGHGMLAEKSIVPVLPNQEENPYTIRIVSDITESNGSSSMATICGATMALMDAGIKIKTPVAGIAMGLVSDGSQYVILTDIAGQEDHYGDMDFKVAGTVNGINALQMDIKIEGITTQIFIQALDQAKNGRLQLLNTMYKTLSTPRDNISKNAPRIYNFQLPKEKVREVIGKGGITIRQIIESSKCSINIDDNGHCQIVASNDDRLQIAINKIKDLIKTAEVGQVYLGKVAKVVEFGAFVTIMPGIDGLLHVSEMALHRIKNPAEEVSEGQEIMVKCIAIDINGKIKLSRKALIDEKHKKY